MGETLKVHEEYHYQQFFTLIPANIVIEIVNPKAVPNPATTLVIKL